MASYVRAFPRVRYERTIVPAIASYGRVVLRDGCFRVIGYRGEDRGLAVFARDADLRLDDQGYLVVGAPEAQGPLARIGEDGNWGWEGVDGVIEPGSSELRIRCGGAPLVYVGIPRSSAHASIGHWTLNRYAERAGLTREQAWAQSDVVGPSATATRARWNPHPSRSRA